MGLNNGILDQATYLPVIEKAWLTWTEEGAEMVREVAVVVGVVFAGAVFVGVALPELLGGFASITAEAFDNNSPQITRITTATITTLFCAPIPSHLER